MNILNNNSDEPDFTMFSTAKLEELKKMAVQLGFLDDVVLYEMELRKRRKLR